MTVSSIILAILVIVLLIINMISSQRFFVLHDAIESCRINFRDYNNFKILKDILLSPKFDENIKVLGKSKGLVNKCLLLFRAKRVINLAAKVYDEYMYIFREKSYKLLTMEDQEKESLIEKLNQLKKIFPSEELDATISLLQADNALNVLLKKVYKESKDIKTYSEFRGRWQHCEEQTHYEIADMDEKYQYMAIFLYYREKEGEFKRKLHKLISKLDKYFNTHFRRRIFEVDAYLELDNRLVDQIKRFLKQGSDDPFDAPPADTTKPSSSKKQEEEALTLEHPDQLDLSDEAFYDEHAERKISDDLAMNETEEELDLGFDDQLTDAEEEPDTSATKIGENDTDSLDLDIPVDLLIEAETETNERALSGNAFNLDFDELESWKKFMIRFNKTPLDSLGGLLGDSGDILHKRYKLAMMELAKKNDASENEYKELEEAWAVIEDLKANKYIN